MSLVGHMGDSSHLVLEVLLGGIVILDWLPEFLLVWRILCVGFLRRVLIAALWTIWIAEKLVEGVIRQDIAKVVLFISLVELFSPSNLLPIYIFSGLRNLNLHVCIVCDIIDFLQLSSYLQ